MQSPQNVRLGWKYPVPSGVSDNGSIIPIIFPSHTDGPEICSEEVLTHYHIDHRFIKDIYFDVWVGQSLNDIQLRDMECVGKKTKIAFNGLKVLPKPRGKYVFMIERLHRLYQDHLLKDNRCPHKGLPILNSCGECPAHGLIWELKTKKLKYELPFYLEIKGSKDRGEIVNSACTISVTQAFRSTHGIRLFLIDKSGRQYPNAWHDTNIKHGCPGDTINLTDKNCGIAESGPLAKNQ